MNRCNLPDRLSHNRSWQMGVSGSKNRLSQFHHPSSIRLPHIVIPDHNNRSSCVTLPASFSNTNPSFQKSSQCIVTATLSHLPELPRSDLSQPISPCICALPSQFPREGGNKGPQAQLCTSATPVPDAVLRHLDEVTRTVSRLSEGKIVISYHFAFLFPLSHSLSLCLSFFFLFSLPLKRGGGATLRVSYAGIWVLAHTQAGTG